jgi:hypothetical protein
MLKASGSLEVKVKGWELGLGLGDLKVKGTKSGYPDSSFY